MHDAVTVPGSPRPAAAPAGPRPLRRRRALPNGRALAGGLLVAVAAVGVFAAYTGATAAPSRSYVVAARDVPVGSRLTTDDLTTAAMDVPASVSGRSFTDASALAGAVVLGPLARGELVQASDVAGDGGGAGHQLSFPIEAARALNGALVPGEHIDLLATYGGAGGESWTAVVARRVLVADVADGGRALTSAGTVVLTVSVDDPAAVLAVSHAARSGTLTVVRAQGDAGGPDVYRPDDAAR